MSFEREYTGIMGSLAPPLLVVLLSATPAFAKPVECVILLHGLARTSHSMVPLEEALRRKGYVVANIDYPSRDHPIEILAPEAVERGLAACRSCKAEVIHFVTHSLGGILVRQYLARNTVLELGRVVMLAPPNQGSEVVDRFSKIPGYEAVNGPAGYQLGTGPESVPNMLGPVTYPVGVIAGTESVNLLLSSALPDPDDGKVSVARTRVEGMADFTTVDASHPFIMRDVDAIRQVETFLALGRFDYIQR
ncbi:MAG TPA: alpha/beta fold hydrolase [Steroidobacteraceae bacterium]|nr:alpha/beta fold hydrolase [Steroidobacteraceae bacterium]